MAKVKHKSASPDMDTGTVVHHILETGSSEGFGFKCFKSVPTSDKNLAKYHEHNLALKSDGLIPVFEDSFLAGKEIADAALEQSEFLRSLVKNGWAEPTGICKHPQLGFMLKSRPDKLIVKEQNHVLIDFKTANDYDFANREYTVVNRNYHFQMALYAYVHQTITGVCPRVVFVFFDKSCPGAISRVDLSPERLQQGFDLLKAQFEKYATCLATNVWPGPDDKTAF